jgi:hypothetical protein
MSLHEMDDGMKEEEVEIITADDTLQEFDIGEAPEGIF